MHMKRNVITCLSLVLSLFLTAQEIHSPAEIIKIMEASKLSYSIKILEKKLECQDYSKRLNYHDVYRVQDGDQLKTNNIKPNKKAASFLSKAEKYFQLNELDSALAFYQYTLNADSTVYTAMTYIGQIYGIRKDYPNAILWYKKAIRKNYIDYMAHWFLADIYTSTNRVNDAVDEIVIAKILNRNNPRIQNAMEAIFTKAKIHYEDWCFNPQYELGKNADSSINVTADEKWLGFALVKAVWEYEPGYRESMGVAKNNYAIIEDRESILSLYMGLTNSKTKFNKDPQFKVLKKALDEKFMDPYIIYEIILPKTPSAAYQLSEEVINLMKEYVLKIRCDK